MGQAKVYIETERLLLRDWADTDADPFARLNADPRVMEFFAAALSREQSDALMASIRAGIARDGYGDYAAEEKTSGQFLGFIGLAPVHFEAHFTPAVEIGWRLAREAWGRGYATEGARAVLDHAFDSLDLPALVSFTAAWNRPSRRVMEKIGMLHDVAGDFLYPKLPPDHKLAPHVLYRIDRQRWLSLK